MLGQSAQIGLCGSSHTAYSCGGVNATQYCCEPWPQCYGRIRYMDGELQHIPSLSTVALLLVPARAVRPQSTAQPPSNAGAHALATPLKTLADDVARAHDNTASEPSTRRWR